MTHRTSTHLFAADGPPQYDKITATLRKAEKVSRGSVMLHIDTEDVDYEYEPGHVLALEIQMDDDREGTDEESKAFNDAKANGGWMRGPYTVSRCTETLDVLMKVVGDKSKRFESAKPGTQVRFGGKFHVPIIEGIDESTTESVVMISTGVGVGPCVGAIEKALEMDRSFPKIYLLASYREEEEVIYKDLLDTLQKSNPTKLAWRPIITGKVGRLSSNEENLKAITLSDAPIDKTHYHLIGNGQMVSEFKSGLEKAGVSKEKITVESYFNHRAEVNKDVIDRIASTVAAKSVVV